MREKLQARIQELTKAAEQSVCNHNAILGALQEAKMIYEQAKVEDGDITPTDSGSAIPCDNNPAVPCDAELVDSNLVA